MFQAQRVVSGKCRPVTLHGYGGAKKEMPTSLAKLAQLGWIPMATAMVGSASSPQDLQGLLQAFRAARKKLLVLR